MPEYEHYKFNAREALTAWGAGLTLILTLAILFYDSVFAVVPLLPILFLYVKQVRKKKQKERLWQLNLEFREGILAVSGALSVGLSVENAFEEGLKNLQFLYTADHPIIKEFQMIIGGMRMNQTIEALLYDFAERSGLEDVQMFAEVFSLSKRTGGNVNEVIADTASRIGDKTDIIREINTFLSAKRLEQNIMNWMPIGILVYVRFSAADFLNGLYKNVTGVLLMTICLLIYGAAYLLSQKIMDIQV